MRRESLFRHLCSEVQDKMVSTRSELDPMMKITKSR